MLGPKPAKRPPPRVREQLFLERGCLAAMSLRGLVAAPRGHRMYCCPVEPLTARKPWNYLARRVREMKG